MPYYFAGNPFFNNGHDTRAEEFAKKLMQEVPSEENGSKNEAPEEAMLPPAQK
jgi:hypothetical protein